MKETILHKVFKNNKETVEPSSSFLYIEEENNYAGYFCHFCEKSSNITYWLSNAAILDEVAFSSKRFAKRVINRDFINDVKNYVKQHNKIYKTNYDKVAVLNFNKLDKCNFIINGVKFIIYEV